jgi:hypothetical protein
MTKAIKDNSMSLSGKDEIKKLQTKRKCKLA